MVAAVLLFYNLIISFDPISRTVPPYTIITGNVLIVKQDMKHQLSEYIKVIANVPKEKSNNTDILCTFPALATCPLCNNQDTHRYFGLVSGKMVWSTHATPLSTPPDCADILHGFAALESDDMTFSHCE